MEQRYVLLILSLVAFYPFLFTVRYFLGSVLSGFAVSGSAFYSVLVEHPQVKRCVVHLLCVAYFELWSNVFVHNGLLPPSSFYIKDLFLTSYASIVIAALLVCTLRVFVDLYQKEGNTSHLSLELYLHISKIVISFCAAMVIFARILELSLFTLVTSLSAAAAFLTFIFKDSILGLLASLQLTLQDIVQIGDWIVLPQYEIEGAVESITITVVKVRNSDKTVSTIPTVSLITSSVKNLRGITDANARRIKRHINIDIDTIKFCDQQMLDRLARMPYCDVVASLNPNLFRAENRITNLVILRHYICEYVKQNEMIYKEGFTLVVRQLQSTSMGAPLEVYAFTKDTDWAKAELIQTDIFDHIYAIVPQFNLRIFQCALPPFEKSDT